MTHPSNRRRRGRPAGFTLVEILVTLVIIILLIGLLVPALVAGLRAGKRSAVKAEISALAQAMADFKVKYGDFPPSRVYLSESGNFPISSTTLVSSVLSSSDTTVVDITVGRLAQRSVAALRKFFPKVQVHTDGTPYWAAGSTIWYDFNGNGGFDANPYILQGHECLTFFLGGIPLKSDNGYTLTGFGTNPSNPFTNSIVGNAMYGANRQTPFYEFAPSRLYLDPANTTYPTDSAGSTRFGIPAYYDSLGNAAPEPGATASQLTTLNFFAYFSTTGLGGGYDPNDVNFYATESDGYLSFLGGAAISPGPNPYTSSTTNPATGTIIYQNPQSFQIITSGFDGLYGIGGQYTPPPAATALPPDATNTAVNTNPNVGVEVATPGSIRNRERDNITNFGAGTQLD